ncbi:DUF418 domain-containing protein [Pseudoduganella namucuonensis]|uniref:DUF418 domain-containing protein n=1 Tax=Pseudoduganella namucuonensis TaxID=1035707 RepID=A0A1I7JPF5_9BURK|nr:DUF418 domain-containing protein [Pseudoduganella namucuonensis]SFU87045.1 uncharacterized protein SAMN05216552_1012118 [Pseudoduganella namucuonensis]
MTPTTSRLDVIDALRGFAIVSIMLLHNIEHFDLYFTPAGLPAWLQAVDKAVWDGAFFLFGGKSYAIFALLFGLTFLIQYQGREQRGEDFRPRFAWRMVLLFGFGMVNSLFYHGDILTIYAAIGLVLIPVARLRGGVVLAIAAFLLLQPAAWLDLLRALPDPQARLGDPASWAYFGRANAYMTGDSLTAVWLGNLTNGKEGVVLWSWEVGRLFQIPALFMLGMLAGRAALFTRTPDSQRFWRRTLGAAAALFVPLYLAKSGLGGWIPEVALRRPLDTIVSSWSNLAFMLVLVSSFVLLYWHTPVAGLQRALAPLGRMSLTSYVTQSIVGTSIYYGFGLGLYKHTGASACLLIGVALATVQCAFSAWWLRGHAQGPLEALWHRATWARRRQPAAPRPVADAESA